MSKVANGIENDKGYQEFSTDDCNSLEIKDCNELDQSNNGQIGLVYWLFLLIAIFVLFNLSVNLQKSCNLKYDFFDQTSNEDEDQAELLEPAFNSSSGRFHLQMLSKLGRRPVGSIANEVHTPRYLLNYFEELNKLTPVNNVRMEISDQLADLNSFPIKLFGQYLITHIYQNIRNIVVRLHDITLEPSNDRAILVNCHYDSYFDGPGISDDLVSCIVMMESIRALLTTPGVMMKHDLIFLFNGAEENMLPASHAFISQHKWAKDVKLFVNLEAAGSGGRQMIFQASANNPWLIHEIASVIKQPLANVVGQEIFSANLIPSDTDFRIFRDFAHLPGIDIAFIGNGYVYHTRYDTEQRIPQQCLTNTGNNILRLAYKLANTRFINEIVPDDNNKLPPFQSPVNFRRVIYFDFLGLILISYTEFTGIIINVSIALLALTLVLIQSNKRVLLIGAIVHLLYVISALTLSIIIGGFIHTFSVKLSWYSNRFNIVGLFVLPNFWWFMFFYSKVAVKFFAASYQPHQLSQSLDNSLIMIFAFAVLLLTMVRLLSCYLLAIWLGYLVARKLIYLVFNAIVKLLNLPASLTAKDVAYFLVDTTSSSAVLVFYFYLLFIVFDFFIPVFGRCGYVPADIVMSGLTTLSMLIPCLAFVCRVNITSSNAQRWLLFIVLHCGISYFLFVYSTDFGFPYNRSELMPRKQRIVFNHITRNLRNDAGQIELAESGVWMIGLDVNRLDYLQEHLSKILREPMHPVFCEVRPYCGYPILYPMARLIDNTLFLPSSTPIPAKMMQPPASLIPLSKLTHISGMVNVTLQISGPSHTHLFIMTPRSMKIVGWSLGPAPPQPIVMPHSSVIIQGESANTNEYLHYFIYNAYGSRPKSPLKLWITFLPGESSYLKPRNKIENQIEMALSAHYLLTETPQLETLLHIIPKWVTPSTILSSYEHIVVDFDKDITYNQ